ncbi:MAG: type II toxin-antitoxin system PemK/MazF family toxin [Desulfobulbaceae bacterium]|nr:type II toxin-antitoxin system PemK/MazF family toxin [Desulfobulbaceae bacterium]
MKRGEIWWAELPEPAGSGSGYKRPLVIIQSNEFNKSKINIIIVAVITSNIRLAAAPGNVLLPAEKSKLPRESVINVSQIITIDKSFLTEKVHTLSNRVMAQVDEGVRLALKL